MNIYDLTLFVNREKKYRGFQKLLLPDTRQAVMVIEAPRDMGKSWLIGKLQHHCEEAGTTLPVATIDFRNPREIDEIQDVLGLVRLLRNKLGGSTHFNSLNAVINDVTSSPGGGGGQPLLRRLLERVFNLDEIQNIAYDLRIEYENIPGNTKTTKVRGLIQVCERERRLPELLALCRQLRPSEDWDSAVESDERAEEQAAGSVTPDLQGQIWADTEMERRRAERLINDAFFACLSVLMEETGQVVLLFDSTEEAPDAAEKWLRDELLLRLRDGQIPDIVVIITGRKTPDLTDLAIKHLTVETGLDPFTEEHIREYFEDRRQLSGLDLRTVVLTSGGVPGALAMMADRAITNEADDDDFFSDF